MSIKNLEVVGRGSGGQKVYPNYIPTGDVPNFCRRPLQFRLTSYVTSPNNLKVFMTGFMEDLEAK